MTGIIVSGGTFSGSGDMTTDYIFVYSGSYIAGEGTTSVMNRGTHPSAGGDTAFTTRSDLGPGEAGGTFDSNGGTMSFNSGLSDNEVQQNIRGVSNALPLYFYNLTALNGGDTYRKMFKDIDVIITNDLTVDDGATLNAESADTAITVSGNAIVTDGTLDMNNANPTICSFGSLAVASAGEYKATTGITLITAEDDALYYCLDLENDVSRLHHNSGTIQKIGTGSSISGFNIGTSTDTLGIYNLIIGDGTTNYGRATLLNANKIYNDVIVSGNTASPTKTWIKARSANSSVAGNCTADFGTIIQYSTHTLSVTGNLILNNESTLDFSGGGDATYGSVTIDTDATFNGSPGTTTVDSRDGSNYSWNDAGTFSHGNGSYSFTSAESENILLSDSAFNDIGFKYGVFKVAAKTGTTFTCGPASIVGTHPTTSSLKMYNSSHDLVMNGKFEMQELSKFGETGWTGAHTIDGELDMSIDSRCEYIATQGITTVNSTDIPFSDTFSHNNGTLRWAASQNIGGNDFTSNPLYNLDIDGAAQITVDSTDMFIEGDITSTGFAGVLAGRFALYHNSDITCGTDTSGSTFTARLQIYTSNAECTLQGKNALYPLIVNPATFDYQGARDDRYLYLGNIDFQMDFTGGDEIPDDYRFKLTGPAEFDAVTLADGALLDCSGQRASFSDDLTVGEDALIISGATIVMEGASNYIEAGTQAARGGRNTANLIWDSTGYYDPNGSYLNNSWKNVFWSADGKASADVSHASEIFRSSNLIIAASFNPNYADIGREGVDSRMVKQLTIANGGTVSGNTKNYYVEDSFDNRGGLFGGAAYIPNLEDGGDNGYQLRSTAGWDYTSSLTNMTVECWIKMRLTNYSTTFNATVVNREDEWGLSIGGTTYGATEDNEFTARVNTNLGSTYLSSTGVLSVDKWHHLALVFDGSVGTTKMYLDAKLVSSSGSTGATINNAAAHSGMPVVLGGKTGAPHKAPIDICELRIWNTSKTQQELMDNMFTKAVSGATGLLSYYPFDEISGNGLSIATEDVKYYDVQNGGVRDPYFLSGNAYAASDPSSTPKQWAVGGGTWTAGGILSSSAGNIYIGNLGAEATIFASSYFPIGNRSLIEGAKFASKAHEGTDEYYIATSGANDYLTYGKLSGAPIGVHNDVKIVPPTTGTTEGSYFTFDANADNEQCNTLVNYGGSYVRILTNEDFYTQDFDNQGTWVRNPTYDGIIHDDGSTPHEYNPIDIMDDQDSGFDTEDLID